MRSRRPFPRERLYRRCRECSAEALHARVSANSICSAMRPATLRPSCSAAAIPLRCPVQEKLTKRPAAPPTNHSEYRHLDLRCVGTTTTAPCSEEVSACEVCGQPACVHDSEHAIQGRVAEKARAGGALRRRREHDTAASGPLGERRPCLITQAIASGLLPRHAPGRRRWRLLATALRCQCPPQEGNRTSPAKSGEHLAGSLQATSASCIDGVQALTASAQATLRARNRLPPATSTRVHAPRRRAWTPRPGDRL